MINLLFKTILKNISISYGYNQIIINNKEYFRKLYNSFNDEVITSEDNIELSNSSILIEKNIVDSDINDKKSINDLYKYLDKYINGKYFEFRNELQNYISNFFAEISNDLSINIDYDDEIDLVKIFQSINLKNMKSDNHIENLVNYIKSIKSNKNKCIITFNLSCYFSFKELEIINKELLLNQIILVDINSIIASYNNCLIVDKDLCIL